MQRYVFKCGHLSKYSDMVIKVLFRCFLFLSYTPTGNSPQQLHKNSFPIESELFSIFTTVGLRFDKKYEVLVLSIQA